jgi:hypothetical protein
MGYTTFSGPVESQNGFISGTSSSSINVTTAQKISYSYATSSASSGDTRLTYEKLTFSSTGSGETYRAYSVVTGTGAAAAGTINGAHISLDVDGTGTISGAGNALRATLGGTSTNPGGTLAAIQVDSNFATGGTWSNAVWLAFTNSGTGKISNALRIPAASNGTVFAAHVTQTMTHSLRIVDDAGTAYYVMCTNAATNRS